MAHDVTATETANGGVEMNCQCGWNAGASRPSDIVALAEKELKHRAQGFFSDFAAEMRKPHFGDMQRNWMNALLTRAIEAKLYTPEEP